MTPEIDGYIPGNDMSFRIWDSESQAYGETEQINVVIGDGTFENGVYAVIESLVFVEARGLSLTGVKAKFE